MSTKLKRDECHKLITKLKAQRAPDKYLQSAIEALNVFMEFGDWDFDKRAYAPAPVLESREERETQAYLARKASRESTPA